MSVPSADELRKFIEKEVLELLQRLSQRDDTPPEKIQELSRVTLELIRPGLTLTELYQNAVRLDDGRPELSPVVMKMMQEYEQKYHKQTLDLVRDYMKDGKHDDVQSAVKKLLEFKAQNN